MYPILPVLIVSLVIAASAPVNEDAQAQTLEYDNTNDGKGNYKFSYKTSNGLFREESGLAVNAGQDNEHIVVLGVYSYIDPEGHMQRVAYIADENGYKVYNDTVVELPTADGDIPTDTISGVPQSVVATLLGKK